MATRRTGILSILFALVAVAVTGAAVWLTWELTHHALGAFGGILAGVAAAMVIGAPFLIVGAVLWGPQLPPAPRSRTVARDENHPGDVRSERRRAPARLEGGRRGAARR